MRLWPKGLAPIHRVITTPVFFGSALYTLAYLYGVPLPPQGLPPDDLGDAVSMVPGVAVLSAGMTALAIIPLILCVGIAYGIVRIICHLTGKTFP